MEDQAEYITAEPRSDMWRKNRLGKFTASEIWKLMGEPRSKEARERGDLSDTARTYILDKIAEGFTGISKDFVNDATVWGIEKEDHARKVYERLTGLKVDECEFIEYTTLTGGTPDGLVGEYGMIEIKCPWNTTEHLKHCLLATSDESLKKNFPEYYWQMMANLLFSGRRWCDFISFDPRIERREGILIYRLEANESEMELLSARIQNAIIAMNEIRRSIRHNCKVVEEEE